MLDTKVVWGRRWRRIYLASQRFDISRRVLSYSLTLRWMLQAFERRFRIFNVRVACTKPGLQWNYVFRLNENNIQMSNPD